jgi:hypothetical protein
MQNLSVAAAATLVSGNQNAAWMIEALIGGQVVFSSTRDFLQSGSVGNDFNADTRRQLNCTLVDPFQRISPFVDIYGQELRIYRGLVYPYGGTELWPLGTFGLTDVQKIKEPALTLKVRGMDRSQAIRAQKLTDSYSIPAGTNYGTAIQTLLRSIIPWLPFSPASFATLTSTTTPLVVLSEGDDPWAQAVKLAASIGMDLYHDPMGVCTMRPVPSVATSPVAWAFIEGQANTAVTMGARGVASEAFSGVLVTAETASIPTGTPIPRSLKWDTDPSSPTYYLGAFGKRVKPIRSPLVQTQAQADAMAAGELRLVAGAAKRVEFTAVPNPALEPGDVIHLASSVIDELHVLENFVIPLKVEELMNAGSRKRTLA